MAKKKKVKAWKYIVFGAVCGALYLFFKINGLDLIEQYPVQIGGLATLAITKLAAKWFGWNISSLFGEEINKKAGEAVMAAKKKAGKKIAAGGKKLKGWAKARIAADKYGKETGSGKLKSLLVTQEVYARLKKTNPELFAKEKK